METADSTATWMRMRSTDEKKCINFAHSAASMMTDLGCSEEGSQRAPAHPCTVRAGRGGSSRPSLLAVSFRAFGLLDRLFGLHSWRLALHSGLGLVRFIGS